jgi:hypothetical protein
LGSSVAAGVVRLVGVIGVLVCGGGWLVGPAWGTTGHAFVGQFGGYGGESGRFAERSSWGPAALAVNAATGDVLAIDGSYAGVPRVQRFDAAGVVQDSFLIEAPFAPADANDMAVDPGSGAVYVSTQRDQDPGQTVVVKYTVAGVAAGDPPLVLDVAASGTSINSGAQVAVDPVDGMVYVTATVTDPNSPSVGAQVIDSFDPVTGVFVASFDGSSGSPDGGFGSDPSCLSDLAVDGLHQLYVLDGCKAGGLGASGRVDRYSAAGAFGVTVDDGSRNGQPVTPLLGVAADPSNSDVYVAETGLVGMQVTHFTAGGTTPVYTFDTSNVVGVLRAMAVSSAGTVYMSDKTSPFVERFARFDGPTVTTDPVTVVGTRGATLNGTFNPEGVDSSYHFEYGTGLTYGSRTPEVDVDGSSGPVAVAAVIGGLNPNQGYHFRLVGSRPGSAGVIAGGDQPLSTLLAPATVDGFPVGSSPAFVSAITPRGASLHGLVNANNTGVGFFPPFLSSSYYFEYGATTAYGRTAVSTADAGTFCTFGSATLPLCDGTDRAVVASVAGLEPATTYHFRVVADNGTGGPQQGADQTFITAPAGAAGAVDVTARRATLRATIDPHGSATTYHFNYGLTAAYGSSTPEVGGGAGDGQRSVTQQISGLQASTTYHVQVVARTDTGSGVVVRSGGDGVFTTPSAPVASAPFTTGVLASTVTLNATATTFGAAGSYHFEVTALDGSYSVLTGDGGLAAVADPQPVSAVLTGLPAGKTFTVRLVVTSSEATDYSDLVTFGTALVPPVPPPLPETDPTTVFGCGSPHIDAYDKHPDPGDVITITGRDLGVSGTVAIGDETFTPTDWNQTAFKIRVPDEATGTLALTVNCGRVSNTIALAVFTEPDNRFTVPSRFTTATATRLVVRVPGPGKLQTTGTRTATTKTTVKKAGEVTLTVKLNHAAVKALAKARTLKVKVSVRYTPAGGKSATKALTITYHHRTTR